MQKIFRNALLTSFASLALAACDSQAENEVEQQATALDEAAEADAEMMEAFAQGAPDEQAVERKAEAVAQEGEQLKDSLENAADEMDETPQ
ncbi:hypothetical protein [Altericroceibacterium xinjiangense]|uniref:hypothetical protein n=1 Tax=Altericroceibacterium xinjiangense TaxID=762261 RepID=UPI000F7EF184|nr:hypothetical protein [Altericroceibacterium xinjiangense]